MIPAWLLSLAFADPPDRLAKLWDINTSGGQVERMIVSPSGDLLVGRLENSQEGWLLDINRWKMLTFSDCAVNGVVPIEFTGADPELWIACADGSVIVRSYDGQGLSVAQTADGVARQYSVAESLSAIWFEEQYGYVYALSVAGDEPTLHTLDPQSEELLVDASVQAGFPKPLGSLGFNEGTIVDGTLFVSHGGSDMSSLILTPPAAAAVPSIFTTPFNCEDLAANPFGGVYCIDSRGQAASYNELTNTYNLFGLGVLDEPQAICASLDLDDGWLAVTGAQVKVWEMDETGAISEDPYYEGPEDADNPINDMVSDAGYLFGGGPEGRLHIVTARPWVYPGSLVLRRGSTVLDPAVDAAAKDQEISLTFQVDEAVDWEVYRGGDRNGGGELLGSGSTDADQDVVLSFVIDEGFQEAVNEIYVVATDSTGLIGHAQTELTVDNPPDPPTLTDANLAFGDGLLTLSFPGIPDEDLKQYEIYVSATEWRAADYPAGGPEFDGTTNLKTPLVRAASGGQSMTVKIKPLENYVTYYVGVRARDQGDKEGPMSNVIKDTPRPTFTAAELAGDPGGTPCSTGTAPAAGWITVGVGLLALGRRRRGALGAALLALSLGGIGDAHAQSGDRDQPWWQQDLTPSRGNFEIRYGVINLADERLADVYRDAPTNLLHAEFGPQFFRVAELDFGFGFFQELAYTIDGPDGVQSGERTMLTWWPLSLDGTARLHLLDEQPLVPLLRYGWDYVIWSEKSDNTTGSKDVTTGAKFGTHWALGLQLLLDTFQPSRASLLEAQSGINDSWLTFEWRRQTVDDRGRPWLGAQNNSLLNFSGDAFMVGIKLDY